MKDSLEDFVRKAKGVHGEKYSYLSFSHKNRVWDCGNMVFKKILITEPNGL